MRNILIMLLLSMGLIMAAPSQKTVSAYDEAKRTQLIEWVEQLRVKAVDADRKAKSAEESLVQSQLDLLDANSNLVKLKENIKKLEDWGNEQQAIAESERKAKEQQAAIAAANKKIADKKTIEAHRNAIQRDISVAFFAIIGTALVMVYGGQIVGFICRTFPVLTPYGIGVWIALGVGSFLLLFGAGEGVLALIYSKL